MLLQYVPQLNAQKKIILASASPRRSEILNQIGLKFEVLVSSFDEMLPHADFPGAAEYAVETARHKAIDVAAMQARLPSAPADLIIVEARLPSAPAGLITGSGTDTVVDLSGKILEKPHDAADAYRILKSLSGSRHQVHTGVALVLPKLIDAGGKPRMHLFSSSTTVVFDELSDQDILHYIESGEPFGKAGAYGIQGMAGCFVKSLEGCYFNVMGFPLHKFSKEVTDLIKDGSLPLSFLE
eukprot:gene15757-21880_t